MSLARKELDPFLVALVIREPTKESDREIWFLNRLGTYSRQHVVL